MNEGMKREPWKEDMMPVNTSWFLIHKENTEEEERSYFRKKRNVWICKV
jgi:hypothetical protein